MENSHFIGELARRLAAAVPPGLHSAQADIEERFQAILARALERMNLPTREEFDIQRKVLERTREKLTALEEEIAALRGELARRREPSG